MSDEANEREEGIKAIIFLQATVGKAESREKAERAWDNFKPWEKQRTMDAYGMLSKKVVNGESNMQPTKNTEKATEAG